MPTPTSDASRCAETTIPCSASTAGADTAAVKAVSVIDNAKIAIRPLSAALRGSGCDGAAPLTLPSPPASGRRGEISGAGESSAQNLANRLVQPLVVKRAF